ncbi:MAG TPA: retropepsin-like aspartic protease [Candidatus Binatia bacterium]|nr:retropepsin-like aspartic protease [Candidatus Binatia bacterium]
MSQRGFCRVVLLACVGLGAPLCAPAAPDDAAAVLLAKHRAFVGWELGDGSFRMLRLARERAGAEGAVDQRATEYRAGIVYRNHYVFPKRADTVEDSGYTGSVFWNTNQNGFTTPVYGDLAKFRLSYAVLFNEGTTELPAVIGGAESVDGRQLQSVRLDVPHADAIEVDVDPDSGAYVRAVIDPGGDEETTVRILSYMEVSPGKKMIGSFRIGEGTRDTYTYTRIEPNVTVTDADLHPPPAGATWTFANPKPIPIAVTPQRVLVDAKVNGVKGRFILDTGANAIFLNRAFADRAKVTKLNARGTTVGLYGGEPSDTRRADTIEIGGNVLSKVIVEATDFNSRDYRGLDRQNYDGLLGYDVFAGALVTVDFRAQTMTIEDPVSQQGDPGGLSILTDTSGWIPTIPMTLDRSIAVKAMLDTGDPGAIIFGPDILYKYHLRMARSIGVRAGMGSVECGNVDSLQIGPITYYGEMACKLDTDLINGRRILVGLDFLRHFIVAFDYPRGRLFLQPLRG